MLEWPDYDRAFSVISMSQWLILRWDLVFGLGLGGFSRRRSGTSHVSTLAT